ncbi:MAG: DUF4173 domain-containing protein [Eubacteriales bacterium]
METINENNPVVQTPLAAPAPPQYYQNPPTSIIQKPPVKFDKTDSIFSGLALIIGFLFFEFIMFGGLGFGVPLFFAAAYAGVMFYGLKSKSIDIKKGIPLSIPIVLLLLCFVLFDNQVLGVLNLIFLFFLATLQFMSMFGVRDHEKLSKGVLFDFAGGFLGRPLMNLNKLFVITAKGSRDEKGKRFVWRIMLGIIICVPLLAVILSLLSSADLAFENVMKKVTDFIGGSVWEYLGKFILGFMAAIPLFGAFFAFRYKQKKGSMKIPDIAGKLDHVIAYTILTVVCAVYLFFLFVQFNYMFLAFRGELPGGFIYSDYARRGFFELVAIAAINLFILAVFYLFTTRKEGKISKVLKTYLLSLSFVTVIIIASAISKMVMYMQVFGLTQMRVYTSWVMILIAVIFLLAIIKIISRKFNAFKIICVFFTVWFLALNFAGIDAMITKYNITKSEQDTSAPLDVSMFTMLSDSMVPDAIGQLDTKDIVAKYDLKMLLTGRYNVLTEKNWQAMNLASLKAKKLLEENKNSYFFGYKDTDKNPKPETDKKMVLGYFPKLTAIESCEWYIKPVFTQPPFNSGSDGYEFYGYVVLKDQYFNEIMAKYQWTTNSVADQYGIEYLNNLPNHSSLVESDVFTQEQAGDDFVLTLLNQADKKLYFYMHKY